MSPMETSEILKAPAVKPIVSDELPVTATAKGMTLPVSQTPPAPPAAARPERQGTMKALHGDGPGSRSGIRIPQFTSVDLGLKVLHEPQDADETTVDIVAIHGIGVDPRTTWHHPASKASWLAHGSMLPSDVPHARIMAFNYDSVWYGSTPARLTIDGVALSLLDALQMVRTPPDAPSSPSPSSSSAVAERPVLFIAHCFGGLVAQRAYTLARMRPRDYPRVPADLVRGLIFLGTPHHGLADGAQRTTREKVYEAISRANMRVETGLHGVMVQDDAVLMSVVDDFTRELHMAPEPRPSVTCYYEAKATYIGLIAGLDMAPEFMVNETAGTLSGHRKVSLPLDHFSLNKFQSRECSHYRHVSNEVREMVKAAVAFTATRADPTSPRLASGAAGRHAIPAFCFPLAQEKNFAPRDGILGKIDTAFQKSDKVALYGESGSGKTHIAVQYAYDYHRDHPSASIYWINASSAEQFELTCHFIHEHISGGDGGGGGDEPDSGKMLAAVSAHLRRASKRDLLIVLDGLEDDGGLTATHDPSQGLLGLLPRGGQARILATSRSKPVAMRWAGSKESIMHTAALSLKDASVLLFGKVLGEPKLGWVSSVHHALRSSAGELALVLQYITLLGSGFAKERKEYAVRIGAAASSSQSQSCPGPETARSGPAATPAWKPLHDLIRAKGAGHTDLMEMMCVIDTQCVPSTLFERAERATEIPDLVSYGIVEPSADRRVLTVTAMVRACVQSFFSQDASGSDAREAAQETALARVSRLFASDPIELLPCALSVLGFKPRSPLAKSHAAGLCIDMANHMGRLKQYARAAGYLDTSARLLEELPASGDKDALLSRVRESRETLERRMAGLLTSAVVVASPGDRSGGSNRDEVGRRREREEESRLRLVHDQAAFELAHSTPEGDVVTRFEETSAWSARTHGADALRSVEQQFNLGLAYVAVRRYADAEKLFQSMLARLTAGEAQSQSSSSATASTRAMQEVRYKVQAELARLCCEQRRFAEARAHYERVYPHQRRLLGDDHQDTLMTRHNLAALRQETGDADGALAELRLVLQAQSAARGLGDPDAMRTVGTIALNSRLRGDLAKAEAQFVTVLKAQTDVLGENHRDTVNTAAMLMDVRDQMRT